MRETISGMCCPQGRSVTANFPPVDEGEPLLKRIQTGFFFLGKVQPARALRDRGTDISVSWTKDVFSKRRRYTIYLADSISSAASHRRFRATRFAALSFSLASEKRSRVVSFEKKSHETFVPINTPCFFVVRDSQVFSFRRNRSLQSSEDASVFSRPNRRRPDIPILICYIDERGPRHLRETAV